MARAFPVQGAAVQLQLHWLHHQFAPALASAPGVCARDGSASCSLSSWTNSPLTSSWRIAFEKIDPGK